jgi:hypothetical protein
MTRIGAVASAVAWGFVVAVFASCGDDCSTACKHNEVCQDSLCVSRCTPLCGAGELCDATGRCLGAVVWSSALEASENVTLAEDGTIYGVFKDSGSYVLLALSQAGQEKWRADLGMIPDPEPLLTNFYPVLAADGTLYVVDQGSHLRAYTQDGSVRWMANAEPFSLHVSGHVPAYPPSVAADGTVYIDSLAAFDATGTLRWSSPQGIFEVDEYQATAIAVGPTALKLVPDQNDEVQLSAFDGASGSPRWTRFLAHHTLAHAAVLVDTSTLAVPVCSQVNVCDKISFVELASGTVTRTVDSPQPGSDINQMVVDQDGTLVVFVDVHGSKLDDPWLWILDPAGGSNTSHLPWNFTLGAALGSDHVLYVTHNQGVAAVGFDGTVFWNQPSDQPVLGVPAIGSDGCILVRSGADDRLSCLRSAATGLARGAWPRSYFGGNHSARR